MADTYDNAEDFTADDLDECLATKFMSASSLGNRKLELTIAGVKNMELRSDKYATRKRSR
jgi:hypothetical protein